MALHSYSCFPYLILFPYFPFFFLFSFPFERLFLIIHFRHCSLLSFFEFILFLPSLSLSVKVPSLMVYTKLLLACVYLLLPGRITESLAYPLANDGRTARRWFIYTCCMVVMRWDPSVLYLVFLLLSPSMIIFGIDPADATTY